MARVVKPQQSHHAFRMVEDGAEVLLVGSGRHAYLWTGTCDGSVCQTYSGRQALRALARAILRNIPPPRKSAPAT